MSPTLEAHPVADVFPMMRKDELEGLAEDIKRNGQQEPILVYKGKILDGRNRERACRIAGVEPKYKQWFGTDSLTSIVISRNLKRRHLTSSQKAALAVELLPYLEEEAKERQRNGAKKLEQKIAQPRNPQSRDQAASILGTNRQYVSDAKKLKAASPELFQQILNGHKTMQEAKEQLQPVQKGPSKLSLAANRVKNLLRKIADLAPEDAEKAEQELLEIQGLIDNALQKIKEAKCAETA